MNVKQVVKKRVDRIQRLADEIGAEVFFPVTGGGISVHLPNAEDKAEADHEFPTLRRTETFLRRTKRANLPLPRVVVVY